MRFYRAEWRPIPCNYNAGGNHPKLVIVHIMQGSLTGTDSWFRNPAAEASAHYGIGKDGTIFQWVDCDDMAWHAAGANDHSIGVENEGYAGHPLTAAQVDANARIFAWAVRNYDVPLWLAKRASGSGLAWHGLGGAAWGGHTGCPGDPIVAQLGQIKDRAKAINEKLAGD